MGGRPLNEPYYVKCMRLYRRKTLFDSLGSSEIPMIPSNFFLKKFTFISAMFGKVISLKIGKTTIGMPING